MQNFLVEHAALLIGACAGLLVISVLGIAIAIVRNRRSAKAEAALQLAPSAQTEVVRVRFAQGSIPPPLSQPFALPLAPQPKSKRKTGLRPTHARRPGGS